MSESGCSGFKDLQDEEIKYLLSDSVAQAISGYPGFKDSQDEEIKYFYNHQIMLLYQFC